VAGHQPVGVIRLQGIPAIRAAAAAFVSTLDRIKKLRDAAQMRRELLAAVQSGTSSNVTLSGDRTLGDASSAQIATMDLEAMRRLIEKWSSVLTTPDSADDAYEALSQVQQAAAGRACNVKIDQICVVAVNNAHCINVSVSVSVNQGLIAKFITRDAGPRQANQVTTRQVSFVCVQTNDFIEVSLNVSVDGALKSAGLARALGLS
jgi:hypothetical protein